MDKEKYIEPLWWWQMPVKWVMFKDFSFFCIHGVKLSVKPDQKSLFMISFVQEFHQKTLRYKTWLDFS